MAGKRRTPQQIHDELVERIKKQFARAAGKGLNAARVFLTARIKETLSVPAPRVRVKTASGDIYYRATKPAMPGSPPRKLSGRLRTSVTSKMLNESKAVVGANARSNPTPKMPGGFNYPAYHELRGLGRRSGEHPFILPTFHFWKPAIMRILGIATRVAFEQPGI